MCCACSTDRRYSHFINIPNDGWYRGDELVYELPKSDYKGKDNLMLMIRTSDSYPYYNLSLIITQKTIPSGRQRTDTIRIELANAENKHEIGLGTYQQNIPIDGLYHTANDSTTVTIHHYMRSETIHGIKDIGIETREYE